MSGVLTEVTPLSDLDCLYIVDRRKKCFNYPIHQHKEFELNFVENAHGAVRVVGDNVEEIGQYDLVLIAGKSLEHTWQQGHCKSENIREITIQFAPDLFPESVLSKHQFNSIREMFRKAEHGICFSLPTIMQTYSHITSLASEEKKFDQFLQFLHLLNRLSESEGRVLASTSFAKTGIDGESGRIIKIKQYISDHYNEPLRLTDLAEVGNMSPTAFSRFFRLSTGRTLSEYIIDVKLGNAARLLIDGEKNISEICYECGFNNQSNFNRIFKENRGMTPRDFRAMYKKNKKII